jgi:hypothetical protein
MHPVMSEYGVVLFHTTSSVMKAERIMVKEGYPVKLIPTPRQFSSDCGIALRFDWNRREQVRGLLDEARVEINAIHLLDTK